MRYFLQIVVLLIVVQLQAQVGGEKSYEFVNIPHSAKLSGLGGINISSANNDVNMLFSNPALVGEALDGHLSFNYLTYFANTSMSSFAYAYKLKSLGTLSGGVQYLNLGVIDSYNASGNLIGTVNSSELNTTTAFAHKIDNFQIGGSLKWVNSSIAENRSNAILFDFGGVFIHPEKDFTVGMVIKNVGFVINEYTATSSSSLPFDLQVGVTYKPEHMPFRFSISTYNIFEKNVLESNNIDNTTFEEHSTFDKVLARFVIGTELVFNEHVNLRIGYNHYNRENLRLEQVGGLAGISLGLMIKIKKIEFAYSYGGYHANAGINNFTIATNVNRFIGSNKINNDDRE